jgi:drug/metabolite transporter (DMT)-like permease
MELHRTDARWRRGLGLALVTAGFWATLPAALKIALQAIDPFTLTWIRFLFAFLVLGLWLGARGELRQFRGLGRREWVLLFVAAMTLMGNYLLYLLGLHRTTPGNAQLLIQAAPLLMALGGIVVFRERYSVWQWLGMGAAVAGLLLFFSDQLRASAGHAGNGYAEGSALVVLAALSWAIYALSQKQLLTRLGAGAILFFIYTVAVVALFPLAKPATVLALRGLPLAMVVYAALNTLGAYGAFAQALAHWEASRVSAVLTITPLLAVATVDEVHALAPTVLASESVSALGWIGAGMIVGGSGLVSMARKRAS